ncbi:M18 family aminopeptidase [Gilvimarinus sp. SDUM040013]|uniref:M18 family aminopeptidase n=1 Tax=Gilvimarinus gilvus TaxID=3058038 RepID=A0ABU4RUB9_9GAMM|nr:M18 family aminopeptidase [Gilvimarinus sp. SDUM040013]MDO3385100.1 M18 family aminopeptidase [Gilvimarinus sp. SDUM040013]MDX6848475.1 M18 family aminopeptidase [Gilvimarinus sp. SDUM040013]
MQRADTQSFNQGLLEFIAASPTPFHATRNMAEQLVAAGFVRLNEADSWSLQQGKRYFVTRNDSSIIAFCYGSTPLEKTGIRMFGAHTDSPCLKLKPNAYSVNAGYVQLAVEVYGGALLNTWFDRDLSIAGRVTYKGDGDVPLSRLIDFQRPVACLPNLAIHLDREANRNKSVNPQKEMLPILMVAGAEEQDLHSLLKTELQRTDADAVVKAILGFELSLYDTHKPALIGFNEDFIASARLDNLLSCYVGLDAMLNASTEQSCLLVCNDHEEVGSASACGAKGPMLEHFLQRLIPDTQLRLRALDASMMISADNAHAIHPNYQQKHDAGHGPMLNGGPVIKVNSNQRYATTSETAALFKLLCGRAGVPVQSFVSRSDMECGSTIGPITSSEVGVKTLDVGVPTFAMHSTRELAGSDDAYGLSRVAKAYFEQVAAPGKFA